jgi:hypothetical protein
MLKLWTQSVEHTPLICLHCLCQGMTADLIIGISSSFRAKKT